MSENKILIPAFPTKQYYDEKIIGETPGMTLRDYFAAKAMIAFMSSEKWVDGLDEECAEKKGDFKHSLALNCYVFADAMVEARNK